MIPLIVIPPLKELKEEKLLIFTEKTFKIIKKEISQFQALYRKIKPKENNDKKKLNLKQLIISKHIPKRIVHEYKPSNIYNLANGDTQRWRRVNEWFRKFPQQSINTDNFVTY